MSAVTESTPRSRPGRQRSEAADHAILSATLDLVAELGYGGLTMAAVIARSGVSSATLYRRWPTKQQLVAAALASLHPEITDVDTGSLEGDIAAMVESLAATVSVRREDLAEDVAVELRRNPEFRAAVNEKFLAPRVASMRAVLERARARGELASDIDHETVLSLVSGPLQHRSFVLGLPITPQFSTAVTRAAVSAIASLDA